MAEDNAFITLFGEDEPKPDVKPQEEDDNPERAANIRAHIELGVRIFGNRAVFASAVGASPASVGNWLAGKMPRGPALMRIAQTLGVGHEALGFEPLPEIVARAEASTAPKRSRRRKTEQTQSDDPAPGPASEEVSEEENVSVVTKDEPEAPAAVPEAEPSAASEAQTEELPAANDTEAPVSEEIPAEAPAPEPVPTDEVKAKPAAAEPLQQTPADEPVASPEAIALKSLPPADDAPSALGSHLCRFMAEKGLTLSEMAAELGGKGAEGRLKSFIVGEAFPNLIELRTLAGILEISVNRLRYEAYLPSQSLSERPDFAAVARDCGLVPASQIADVKATEGPQPVEPVPEPVPEPEPEARETAAEAADNVEPAEEAEPGDTQSEISTLRLGKDLPEALVSYMPLRSCGAGDGLLGELARSGAARLYPIPNNDLAPAFEAGDLAVIDARRFGEGKETDAAVLGLPGWYLVAVGGLPVVRRLVPKNGRIEVCGTQDSVESFECVSVLGAVAAKIAVKRI